MNESKLDLKPSESLTKPRISTLDSAWKVSNSISQKIGRHYATEKKIPLHGDDKHLLKARKQFQGFLDTCDSQKIILDSAIKKVGVFKTTNEGFDIKSLARSYFEDDNSKLSEKHITETIESLQKELQILKVGLLLKKYRSAIKKRLNHVIKVMESTHDWDPVVSNWEELFGDEKDEQVEKTSAAEPQKKKARFLNLF
eukprot:TRINITY_DN2048_c1_g1_i1.p1 TRINITY_DN2048_c1_g1~~TRINITY_DN2048_c1_g1_i1.p1  ORF type:complete len:198 (-),score=41.97 TRINITY_DN2048_c1_g1_i1:52-645(-)